MVYVYLPAVYYHLNLDVTKWTLLAEGFSAVPAVFLSFFLYLFMAQFSYIIFIKIHLWRLTTRIMQISVHLLL